MTHNTRNTGQTRRGLNRLRVGDDDSGETMAYQDAGSIPQAVRGDEDGPWIKGPPFTTEWVQLYEVAVLVKAGTVYTVTPDISVLDWRILTLAVDYVTTTAADQLSIIPEFSMDDFGDTFFPIGVVESAITAVDLLDTNVPFEPPFGSRNLYPAELRTVALADGDTYRCSVTFDVGSYNRFRFVVGSLLGEGDGGALILNYALNV